MVESYYLFKRSNYYSDSVLILRLHPKIIEFNKFPSFYYIFILSIFFLFNWGINLQMTN